MQHGYFGGQIFLCVLLRHLCTNYCINLGSDFTQLQSMYNYCVLPNFVVMRIKIIAIIHLHFSHAWPHQETYWSVKRYFASR